MLINMKKGWGEHDDACDEEIHRRFSRDSFSLQPTGGVCVCVR